MEKIKYYGLTTSHLLRIWKNGGWRDNFYLEVNKGEGFGKAFLKSAKKSSDIFLNNFSSSFYPGVASDVKLFQRKIIGILFDDDNGKGVEDVLKLLGETSENVSRILLQCNIGKKRIRSNGIQKIKEEFDEKIVLKAWESGWKIKFEELLNKGMSFGVSLLLSAREIKGEEFIGIRNLAKKYSSKTVISVGNFVSIIGVRCLFNSGNINNILMFLYNNDEKKVISLKSLIIENKRKTRKKFEY